MIRQVFACILCAAATVAANTASPLDTLPLRFEANRGQHAPGVRFVSRAGQRTFAFEQDRAVVGLGKRTVAIRPAGANPAPSLAGQDLLAARSAYLRGQDRSKWVEDVPNYASIRYSSVYNGIDMVYRGTGKALEYDFHVAPGADPAAIRLEFPGADKLALDSDGSLVITAGEEQLRQPLPVAFQDLATGRRSVDATYRIAGNRVSFRLGKYDRTQPLVIDPVLVATYFGGESVDVATNVQVAPNGTVWVAGYTASPELPKAGFGYREQQVADYDVFIARFSRTLSGATSLEYSTYIGGGGEDRPTSMVLDGQGFLLLAGYTSSLDFPAAGGASQLGISGARDAFVLRFSLTDQGIDGLWFSSYFGGMTNDVATAVAAGPNNRAYIVGYTLFDDPKTFPTEGTPIQSVNRGGYEAFLAEFDLQAASGALRYSTFLGGDSTDVATGVVVDSQGYIWMSGYTMSENFPTTGGALRETYAGRGDAFLVRVDRSKSGLDALDYSTLVGGADADLAYGLVRDSRDRLYLTGYTFSQDFPVTVNAHRTSIAGNGDVFLTRIDPSLAPAASITYSTYIGGNSGDVAYGIALDNEGRVALTGYTHSTDFPIAGGAVQAEPGGLPDAFLAVVNTDGTAENSLVYSSFIGGPSLDSAGQVAVDPIAGNYYLAGSSTSRSLASLGSFQPEIAGLTDALVMRVSLCNSAESCAAQGLTLTSACTAESKLSKPTACRGDGKGGFICTQTACPGIQ